MKKTLISLLLCLLTIGSFAHAELIAYDGFGFDDYSLAGIDGQNPDIMGFTGAWSGNGSVIDENLSYLELWTQDYCYRRSNGSASRSLDVSPTGPFASLIDDSGFIASNILYVSFLMTSPNTNFSGFFELQDSGSRAARIGINDGIWSRRIGGGGWSPLPAADEVVMGATNLVVFRLDLNAGGNRQYYRVWINPEFLGEGGDIASYYIDFDVGTIVKVDGIMMASYFSEESLIDEIRLGTSYADVTPIPEPSLMISLLAMLSFILLRRKV